MATSTHYKNPKWWESNYDSAWDRVKAAFSRDWDQTKHDFGGDEPDINQGVTDTVKQAAGKQVIPPPNTPTYEEAEPAYRFGYGARKQYGKEYSAWNTDLEKRLERDWQDTYSGDAEYNWPRYRGVVRKGWDYTE